jgi:hypothetical protein
VVRRLNVFIFIQFVAKEADTIMWQQGGYGVLDSGVHSGATTGAHSVREEELDDPLLFDLDSQGYTGFTPDQVDGMGMNNG